MSTTPNITISCEESSVCIYNPPPLSKPWPAGLFRQVILPFAIRGLGPTALYGDLWISVTATGHGRDQERGNQKARYI